MLQGFHRGFHVGSLQVRDQSVAPYHLAMNFRFGPKRFLRYESKAIDKYKAKDKYTTEIARYDVYMTAGGDYLIAKWSNSVRSATYLSAAVFSAILMVAVNVPSSIIWWPFGILGAISGIYLLRYFHWAKVIIHQLRIVARQERVARRDSGSQQ